MHEYPATLEFINIAAQKARAANARRVTRVRLVVGEQSGLAPESIQMYFEIIAEGTVCADAALEIETVKTKWRCPRCDIFYERRPLSFACPRCGEDGEPTSAGREFYVDSIEVAD
ncbi:MAG: hydrogenase maturation nickel metallochaperone HypA [Gracilibacteraceae bacterium]|jgi:hydrogenase nickel incorporation protein HypA/HybF|nr:hydrogenase maturation nickel metallochaperone HypA [Gracilibacteraceae bacterium]